MIVYSWGILLDDYKFIFAAICNILAFLWKWLFTIKKKRFSTFSSATFFAKIGFWLKNLLFLGYA